MLISMQFCKRQGSTGDPGASGPKGERGPPVS